MTESKNITFSDWKKKLSGQKPARELGDKLLSVAEVSEKLGVERTTIWRWRKTGYLPDGFRLGAKMVKWPESVIDQWIAERMNANG